MAAGLPGCCLSGRPKEHRVAAAKIAIVGGGLAYITAVFSSLARFAFEARIDLLKGPLLAVLAWPV
jgi:hypothetical protein